MLQIALSPDSPTPLVDQIVAAVRTRIDDRILRPGARLPSIRQFAEQHGVSRFTVVEAYDRLVALGHLQSRRGSGFYVANRASPARAMESGQAIERAIDAAWLMREMTVDDPARILAGSGNLPAAWLDEAGVLRALRALSRRTDVRPVSYGSPQGYAPLRAHLQVRLAEIGIGATPEQIVLTYGVHQALDIVCRYFLKPGDCVLVDDPGYWNLFGNLRLYGVALVGVPRTPDGPDTQALEALLAHHQPRLFFTHSVLHNPTAGNLSPATAFRVLQLAEKHDFMIVEDDIYGDLAPDAATRLAGLDQLTRVIYTSSFSKTISGNLRVGFLACRPDLAHLFTDVKIVTMMSSAEISEQLIHQLLTDGHYASWSTASRAASPTPPTGRCACSNGLACNPTGSRRAAPSSGPAHRASPTPPNWPATPPATTSCSPRATFFGPKASLRITCASTSASVPIRGSNAFSAKPFAHKFRKNMRLVLKFQ